MHMHTLARVGWAGMAGLLLAGPAFATTRFVNVSNAAPAAPFTNWSMAATNIQAAIDAAASGEEVLVAPGIYYHRYSEVNIPAGKTLTLRSTQSRAAIIDAQGLSRGILVEGAGSVVEGFTVRNGSVLPDWAGGGVLLSTNSVVQDCLLTGNAAHSGGGIYALPGAVVRDCLIVGNQARNAGGGALLHAGAWIQNCSIASNTAPHGGGIELYEAGTATDCLIEGNTASTMGGGVVFYSGTTGLVRNCVIRNNAVTNTGGNGGGVNIQHAGTVSNCWISGNSATATNGNGGGVYMNNSGLSVSGRLVNVVLNGNWAGERGGGVYSVGPNGTLASVINCTIVSNAAGVEGGGVQPHTTRMVNDIIYFNTAPTNANLTPDGTDSIVSNCCTTSNYFWPNITNAPAFVNAAAGDFRLATASFCIDAGTTNAAPRSDIEGNPRPRRGVPGMGSTNCDMGAYEYGFHFNSIRTASSNAIRLQWDVQDAGRYRVDVATNAGSHPLAPTWSSVTVYTQATIIGQGQYAVYTTTVTNPVPPMPDHALFRLRVDRATLGK